MKPVLINFIFICAACTGVSYGALWGAGTEGPSEEEKMWYQLNDLVERLSQEDWKHALVLRELHKIEIAAEDLKNLDRYPGTITRIGGAELSNISKRIAKTIKKAERTKNILADVKAPIQDAIHMTLEMLKDEPNLDMINILISENIARIQELIKIKKYSNLLWSELSALLTEYEAAYGISRESMRNELFDDQFFKVLISQIGETATLFYQRLNHYKDVMSGKATRKQKKRMAQIDFDRVLDKLNDANSENHTQELERLAQRFEKEFPIGGIQYYLGKGHLESKHFEKAVAAFRRVGEESSFYGLSRLGVLEAFFSAGEDDSLVQFYSRASSFPDSIAPYAKYLAVQSFYQLGRDADLERVILSFERKSETYYKALFVYGKSLVRKVKDGEANSVFKQIIKNNNLPFPLRGEATLALAYLKVEQKYYGNALADFKVLMDFPEFQAMALYGMVWCHANLNDPKTAELTLKKLINQYPDSPMAIEGIMLFSKWKYSKGRQAWQYKKVTDDAKRKTEKIQHLLNESEKKGEYSTAQLQSLNLKQDAQRKKNSERLQIGIREIDNAFKEAFHLVDYIDVHYRSGKFSEMSYSDQRKAALAKLERVAGTGKTLESAPIDRLEIQHKIIQSQILKLDMLINYRKWLEEVSQFYKEWQGPREADRSLLAEKSAISLNQISRIIDSLLVNPLSANYTDKLLFYKGLSLYEMQREKREAEWDARQRYALDAGAEWFVGEVYSEDEFEKYWSSLLENFGDSEYRPMTQYFLGKSLLEQGDSRGRDLLLEFAKAYPKHSFREFALFKLGEHHFFKDHFTKASTHYLDVLKDPGSKHFNNALYRQAWVYYKTGEHQKAIRAFSFLLKEELSKPDSIHDRETVDEMLKMLASTFAETKLRQSVIDDLIKGTFDDVQHRQLTPIVFHKLAVVYRRQGKLGKAKDILNNLINNYPGYPDLPGVNLELAKIYDRNNQFSKSVGIRKRIYEEYNPESNWYLNLNNKERILRTDSIVEEALVGMGQHYFTEATLKNKSRPGDTLSNESEYLETIFAYEKILEIYSYKEHAPKVYYQLAESYYAIGDYFNAAKFYMLASQKMKGRSRIPAAYNAVIASKKFMEIIEGGRSVY